MQTARRSGSEESFPPPARVRDGGAKIALERARAVHVAGRGAAGGREGRVGACRGKE